MSPDPLHLSAEPPIAQIPTPKPKRPFKTASANCPDINELSRPRDNHSFFLVVCNISLARLSPAPALVARISTSAVHQGGTRAFLSESKTRSSLRRKIHVDDQPHVTRSTSAELVEGSAEAFIGSSSATTCSLAFGSDGRMRQLISNDSTYEFKDSSMSGTPTYVCTNITWKEGDKIHFVSQPERTFKLNKLIPQHSVPVEAFLPLLPPDITPLVEPLPDSHFIKRVAYKASPLSVENAARLAAHTLAEVQLWETILRHHPHSNVMKYHGVVSDGERITGIVLERCKKTIGDARLEVDCERVLKEVRSAVDHLHSLGLIHCDINHHNVMIDSTGSALLIDFDSCKKEGGVRGGGTVGYTNEFNNSIASRELDYYALDRLEVYIRTGSFGVSHSPEEITERNAAFELAAAEQDSAPSTA